MTRAWTAAVDMIAAEMSVRMTEVADTVGDVAMIVAGLDRHNEVSLGL